MRRHLLVASTLLALLCTAGCRSRGPAPKEGNPSTAPAAVGSTETGGAHPGPSQDPHAGVALPGGPPSGSASSGQPDDEGMIDVGAIAFALPDPWQAEAPSSAMRRAQLVAPGSAGPAELVVYYFGEQGAGAANANIDRWVGQFTQPDGSPVTDAEQTRMQVSGFDVLKVDVRGQYAGGMGPPGQAHAAKPGQRLLAAIVSTDSGPYYFKFLGPAATVTEHAKAFDGLLESVRAR